VFSLVSRCQGLCGSQKQIGRPVLACWAISTPWSQVNNRRSCSGNVVMDVAMASLADHDFRCDETFSASLTVPLSGEPSRS
jgi:hypothetical protein